MDWRQWLYDQMQDPDITAACLGGVHAAGSLEGAPEKKPFMVLRLGLTQSALQGADDAQMMNQEALVFVHDEPGSYVHIDELLRLVHNKLVGQVAAESAVACTWQGDSGELSDEFYRTIQRTGSYRLIGRTT